MKKSIKTIIFAMVFGSFMTTANIVKANDHFSVNTEVILVNGTEASFANYMSKNAKALVKKNDWKIFTKVVTLYNASPSQFMAVSNEDKLAFAKAVERIEAKLTKLGGTEAKVWKKKVTTTASVMNVLWNYSTKNIEPTESEEVEMPMAIEMIGR